MVSHIPDLTPYMNKRLSLQLNGSRVVVGTLKGFDLFLNVVLEDSVEESKGEVIKIGTAVIRGESIVALEAI